MFISPISSVNTNTYRKTQVKKVKTNENPQPQQPTFRGDDGITAGLGLGTAGTFVILASAIISGGLTLPAAIIGGPLILAGGAGGAYLGDKIEDKIKGKSDKND